MTMHKALYHRDDVDWLYVSRKKGGRVLASIENSVDVSLQQLNDYWGKNMKEGWLQPSEMRQTTQWTTVSQYNKERSGKKNISMDDFNDS